MDKRVTRSGIIVHPKTSDHRHSFNKKLGLKITNVVGTMWAAYIFSFIAFLSLPSILSTVIPSARDLFPSWIVSASLVSLVLWISSEFMQLVLLPIIIVGQNAQAEAMDARNEKGFEDTEKILDALDLKTKGGMSDLYAEIILIKEHLKNDQS